MAERRVRLAAYALSVDNGAVLLAQISDHGDEAGWWTLPGGGLEFGEHPEAGVARELYEETGLAGPIISLLGVDSLLFPDTPDFPDEVHSVRIVYRVDARGEPTVTEVDGTVQEARWIPLSDLGQYPTVNLVDFALEQAGLR